MKMKRFAPDMWELVDDKGRWMADVVRTAGVWRVVPGPHQNGIALVVSDALIQCGFEGYVEVEESVVERTAGAFKSHEPPETAERLREIAQEVIAEHREDEA